MTDQSTFDKLFLEMSAHTKAKIKREVYLEVLVVLAYIAFKDYEMDVDADVPASHKDMMVLLRAVFDDREK